MRSVKVKIAMTAVLVSVIAGGIALAIHFHGTDDGSSLPIDTVAMAKARVTDSTTISVPGGWALTFDDEFNGTQLDPTSWTALDRSWSPAWGKNHLEYFSPHNVSLQDGYLRMMAETKQDSYASGAIVSWKKFAQLYGRFEVRARFPQAKGSISQLLMWAEPGNAYPSMELAGYLGGDNKLAQDSRDGDETGLTLNMPHDVGDQSMNWSDWHVYAIDWDKDKITWAVDGKPRGSETRNVPHEPMNFSFFQSVEGKSADGPWPAETDIDYVRAYRKVDDAPPVNAGEDQVAKLPSAKVQLDGYTCNPANGYTVRWTKVAGPGNVTFADPSSTTSSASFNKAGKYVLRMSVSDGKVTGAEDTSVFVYGSQSMQLKAIDQATTGLRSFKSNNVNKGFQVGEKMWVISRHPDVARNNWVASQGYLRFDISHVGNFQSATLRLNGGLDHGGKQPDFLVDINDPVGSPVPLGLLTWNNRPSQTPRIASFAMHSTTFHNDDRWIEVDLTSFVKAAVKAHRPYITLQLSGSNTDTRQSFVRSAWNKETGPALIIQ